MQGFPPATAPCALELLRRTLAWTAGCALIALFPPKLDAQDSDTDPGALPAPAPAVQSVAQPGIFSAIPVAWWQIALDRNHFSPGFIDGKYGRKTAECVRQWQISKGYPATGILTPEQRTALEVGVEPFTDYQLSADDFDQIGVVPTSWEKKAAQASLPYQSVEELLSEKFHCTPAFLQALNPGQSLDNLEIGDTLRVPRVNSRPKATFDAAEIWIGMEQFALWVLNQERHIIAYFPVSIGRKDNARLISDWKIINHADLPSYTFDPINYPESPEAQSLGRRLLIPPGPNSPVGVYWMGLGQGGIGIHGTPSPETIGSAESHGCFRLQNWNISKLARLAANDVPVYVRSRVTFKSANDSSDPDTKPSDATKESGQTKSLSDTSPAESTEPTPPAPSQEIDPYASDATPNPSIGAPPQAQ